jgi:DNA polymerase IV
MPLRYLFVDMNAYFASVEQQDQPKLRGRPVAVVPVEAETTCCLTASYEARAFGIKTGMPVWQARVLCPGLRTIKARPERYVRVHRQIVEAVGRCLPVSRIVSIDELICRLEGDQRRPETAAELGRAIKGAILREVGDHLRCSVGVASNALLAKVAADMQKPDGLTVLPPEELPGALHQLELIDFPGIGRRMNERFRKCGVYTVAQMCQMTPAQLSHVWKSRVHGWTWWYRLRGDDVPDKPTVRRTVSHSHVLPPEQRTATGATAVLVRLLHKVAARMRKIEYRAGTIAVSLSFIDREGWSVGRHLAQVSDTHTLLEVMTDLLNDFPRGKPVKVGVVLADLTPGGAATPSLFGEDRKWEAVSRAMDEVNEVYGPTAIYFGSMFAMRADNRNPIAFTNIPDV